MSTQPNSQAAMIARAVALEPSVFLMGCSLASVHPATRARSEERNLSLGSLLAPTPPRWVRLPAFRIGKALVTNGEYREFLRATVPGSSSGGAPDRILFDDPDLWRYVWRDLGYRVEQQRVWLVRSDGPPASQEERYEQVDNFVDAYVRSLRFETSRILAGPSAPLEPVLAPTEDVIRVHGEEGTTFATLRRDPLVDKIFAAIQARLGSGGGARGRGSIGLRRSPPAPLELGDMDQLIGRLEERMAASVAAQPQLFGRPGLEPEPLLFLLRCRESLYQDQKAPLRPSLLLYPRTWATPDGEPPRLFAGPDVPWEDRPVLGVSLYEALAFVTWLSSGAPPGEFVTLPSEAEFERAASWPEGPADDRMQDGPPLDDTRKDIYPWQRRFPEADFHEFFGAESKELALYFTDRGHYQSLLEHTARVTQRGERIDMLLGFGWQWTVDRFDEEERAYSRFADNSCKLAFERPRRARAAGERAAPVYDYVPNRAVRHGSFVARGAPDLIGGQGLTTRRFALNPMRGYPSVGFRWVVKSSRVPGGPGAQPGGVS